MGRQLSTPEPQRTAHHEALTRINIDVPHVWEQEAATYGLSREDVLLAVEVRSVDDEGHPIGRPKRRSVTLEQMPPALKTLLRDFYAELERLAENAGLLGARRRSATSPPRSRRAGSCG